MKNENTMILVNEIKYWWENHKDDTIQDGDGVEHNLHDETPKFIHLANKLTPLLNQDENENFFYRARRMSDGKYVTGALLHDIDIPCFSFIATVDAMNEMIVDELDNGKTTGLYLTRVLIIMENENENIMILINEIKDWWENHKDDTIQDGDGVERNLYNETPKFIYLANKLTPLLNQDENFFYRARRMSDGKYVTGALLHDIDIPCFSYIATVDAMNEMIVDELDNGKTTGLYLTRIIGKSIEKL